MSEEKDTNNSLDKNEDEKKEYTPPTIESEDVTTYGAACNGTNRGGRKASTSATPPCNPSKLTS